MRAHVSKLAALDTALEGGVDVIEHVPKPDLSSAALQKVLADLIVVNGDPLSDLSALAKVSMVIQGGEIAYRAEP